MAKRVTNQDAKAFAVRHNQFGRALKTPSQGGPSMREFHLADDSVDFGILANARARTQLATARAAYTAGTGTLQAVTNAEDAVRRLAATRAKIHSEEFIAQHPRYPDYAYPDDQEEDTRIEKKIRTLGWFGGQATLPVTDKDIDYLERKKEAQQYLKFKSFVEDSLPRGTLWAREFFENIMPGWYQSKQEIIQDKFALLRRYAEITLHGPRNIDDMFVLYQFYQGNINLAENFNDMIRGTSNTLSDKTFHSGFFGPRRYLDKSLFVAKRNQDFMANFAIPGIDLKSGSATDADRTRYLYEDAGGNVRPIINSDRSNPSTQGALGTVIAEEADLTPEGAQSGYFPAGFGRRQQAAPGGNPLYPANLTLGRQANIRSTAFV